MPWFDNPGPIWNAVDTLPLYSPGLADAPPPSGVHGCFTVTWRIVSTRPQGKLVQSGASVLFALWALAPRANMTDTTAAVTTPVRRSSDRSLDGRRGMRSTPVSHSDRTSHAATARERPARRASAERWGRCRRCDRSQRARG